MQQKYIAIFFNDVQKIQKNKILKNILTLFTHRYCKSKSGPIKTIDEVN